MTEKEKRIENARRALAKLRKDEKLSWPMLSGMIGVSWYTIWRFLKKKVNPNYSTLAVIEMFLEGRKHGEKKT